MNDLKNLKDSLARELYGKTTDDAVNSGLCIDCGEPALENCYSDAGRAEVSISGLCELCFDKIMGGGDR